MKKKVLMAIFGVVAILGIVNVALSVKKRTKKCSCGDDCAGVCEPDADLSLKESKSCSCGGSCGESCTCKKDSDTAVSCCGGNSSNYRGSGKSYEEYYKERVLYEGNDGTIKEMMVKDLESYVGKPQPALAESLVLYYAACGKEEAQEISEDTNTVFVLTPNNGRFEVELSGKIRCYVGVCLPEEELFLWAKANKKELYARPSGKMYSVGQGCNEKWYVQLELLRTC